MLETRNVIESPKVLVANKALKAVKAVGYLW